MPPRLLSTVLPVMERGVVVEAVVSNGTNGKTPLGVKIDEDVVFIFFERHVITVCAHGSFLLLKSTLQMVNRQAALLKA